MATLVKLHPHARERAEERGASESEIVATIESGDAFGRNSAEVGSARTSHLAKTGAASDIAPSRLKRSLLKKGITG
jgi:hypothetical protein